MNDLHNQRLIIKGMCGTVDMITFSVRIHLGNVYEGSGVSVLWKSGQILV